jgi:hypothetical protein
MEAKNIWVRIVENCPDTTAGRFWPKCFWPLSSPDLNVMDFPYGEFEFAPIVNHHVERDLLDSVVTRTY